MPREQPSLPDLVTLAVPIAHAHGYGHIVPFAFPDELYFALAHECTDPDCQCHARFERLRDGDSSGRPREHTNRRDG